MLPPADYTRSKKRAENPTQRGQNIISENLGVLIEDFFANGLSIRNIAKKYGLQETTVSRYLTPMFSKRLTEDTKIITLKSKV